MQCIQYFVYDLQRYLPRCTGLPGIGKGHGGAKGFAGKAAHRAQSSHAHGNDGSLRMPVGHFSGGSQKLQYASRMGMGRLPSGVENAVCGPSSALPETFRQTIQQAGGASTKPFCRQAGEGCSCPEWMQEPCSKVDLRQAERCSLPVRSAGHTWPGQDRRPQLLLGIDCHHGIAQYRLRSLPAAELCRCSNGNTA